MKILSWNVNGLRAVYKKGFWDWLEKLEPDIICLQEIKARKKDLSDGLLKVKGYHVFLNSAGKPGYAGVAVYTKKKPLKAETKIGLIRFDREGRMLKLKYPNFTLFNFYFPHGGRKKENLDYKLKAYGLILKELKKIKNENVILTGDFNIAHKEIDLARPKQNKNNIMFTPKERKQIDKIIELEFVDTFRMFNQEPGNYTWLSYFKNAKERGLGWRIDYIFASLHLKPMVENAFILCDSLFGSDHCPLGIQIILD